MTERKFPVNACSGWQCHRPIEFVITYGPTTVAACLAHVGEVLSEPDSEGDDNSRVTVERVGG